MTLTTSNLRDRLTHWYIYAENRISPQARLRRCGIWSPPSVFFLFIDTLGINLPASKLVYAEWSYTYTAFFLSPSFLPFVRNTCMSSIIVYGNRPISKEVISFIWKRMAAHPEWLRVSPFKEYLTRSRDPAGLWWAGKAWVRCSTAKLFQKPGPKTENGYPEDQSVRFDIKRVRIRAFNIFVFHYATWSWIPLSAERIFQRPRRITHCLSQKIVLWYSL